ncbi:MAG: tetratricopeptide repeat protein [Prevotellaceae bacterium]|nr:tetratricopeptide repeat protein [Prevotellaceae bacterium]
MGERLQEIRLMIGEGKAEAAIGELNALIRESKGVSDEPYYLLGNAYRKKGDWQQALNNYLEAIERNPESPAASAREMLMSILDFRYKDMYNQ